jgi:hypothetical protein
MTRNKQEITETHTTSKTQFPLSSEIGYRQSYVIRIFEKQYHDNEQWFCSNQVDILPGGALVI